MIYLPNPCYNFESSSSGFVAQLNPLLESSAVNLDKLCKVFKRARSNYWDSTISKGETFCFIREDGAEFAIRILKNSSLDVIGYWRDIPLLDSYSSEMNEVDIVLTILLKLLEETNEELCSYSFKTIRA